MPRVIYLGLFALPEHTPITLSALQQAPEEVGALRLETHSTSQFEVLSNWLQQESKPEAVLIWPKPTGFIADYLAREEPIDVSLVQWKDMAKRLLKLFRSHRSQLTLLGMAPGERLTLSGELPAKITDVISQAEATVERLPEATPLYRLAAAQLVAEDAELQDELAFLSASSHACSASTEQTSETVRSALQSAKESHHAKQQLKVLTNERDRAMEESKLLLTQLNSVQKALEVAQHQANNAAASQQTEQQLRKMVDERDSAQEENELLLTQLHIVQEALEEAYIELKSGIGESEGKRLKGIMTWLRAHARRQSAAVYKGRDNQALKELVDLLEQSELFDADWYLTQYKDIAEANINPAEHFIKFGAIEGRNPGPRFNTEFYVVTYPDVAASGHHPLLHYLRDGINEQRKTQESPT
ncbi:hypothetical protein [Vreelandella titanicae]|uniref:hypothetical protein n=1 Tax=Vreelandella titanicae TaxID=664683 RepID=UPI00241F75A1|nr:hypothetical protein [Halomonas titanicae]